MTTQRDNFLQEIQSLRSDLGHLLEGMDYCLDWKPNDEEWSAREIIYHMVYTPSGGIHTAIQRVLHSNIQELLVDAGLTNLTPERQGKGLGEMRGEVEAVLVGMESALASITDAELTERRVPFHNVTRGTTLDRTAQELVTGIFLRHWREHLGQLAALREGLGLG